MAKRFLIVLLILSVTSSTMLMGCSLGSLGGLGGLLGGLGGGGGGIIQAVGIGLSVFSLLTTVSKFFTGGTDSTTTAAD